MLIFAIIKIYIPEMSGLHLPTSVLILRTHSTSEALLVKITAFLHEPHLQFVNLTKTKIHTHPQIVEHADYFLELQRNINIDVLVEAWSHWEESW